MPAPQQIAQFRPNALPYCQPTPPAIQHIPQGVGAAPQALPYLTSQSFAVSQPLEQQATQQLPQLTYQHAGLSQHFGTQSQAFIPQQVASQNFAQGPIQSSLSQHFALQQLAGQQNGTVALSAPSQANINSGSCQFTPEQNAAIEQAQQAAAAQIAQVQAQAQQQRAAIEQAAQQVNLNFI